MPRIAFRQLCLFSKRYSEDFKKVLFLFFVQFCIILPYFYWNVPWSLYFKILNRKTNFTKQEEKFNEHRSAEVKKYFNDLDPVTSLRWYDNRLHHHSDDLEIVVAIVTTNRNRKKKNLGYLLQTAGQMDRIIKNPENFRKMAMFVCNVDKDPANHEEAKYLKSYLPFVERFGTSVPHIPDLYIPDTNISLRDTVTKGSYDKETIDYIYCLQAAKTWPSKRVLILEDDAIVRDNLLDILDYKIKHLHDNQNTGNMTWTAFKLYYPEKWCGYAFEQHSILELCATVIVGATLFTLFICAIRGCFKAKFSVYTSFIIGIIFSIFSCYAIGRQNILELRRVSSVTYQLVPSPGCCTPAMMYQHSVLDPLSISMYRDAYKAGMKVDFALAKFLRHQKVPSYLIVPNLVRHIGRITSLPKADKKPIEFI